MRVFYGEIEVQNKCEENYQIFVFLSLRKLLFCILLVLINRSPHFLFIGLGGTNIFLCYKIWRQKIYKSRLIRWKEFVSEGLFLMMNLLSLINTVFDRQENSLSIIILILFIVIFLTQLFCMNLEVIVYLKSKYCWKSQNSQRARII